MVSREQALTIAHQAHQERGFAPNDYNVELSDADSSESHWLVWFDRKGEFPVPGGKHAVQVDKTTGQALFLPGE